MYQGLGCVAVLLVGALLWAIVEALTAKKRSKGDQQRLDTLSLRLDQIDSRLTELRREMRSQAADSASKTPPPVDAAKAPAAPPPVPVIPIAPPPLPPMAPSSTASPLRPTASRLPTPAVSPLPSAAAHAALDWESLISVRAFAWLGGGALFLGAALFLQYSIQHGLISPAARVAIGLLVGAIALAGGDWLRSKAAWAGQAISGAGVAILYASLFAAHARYALLSSSAALVGMVLVTLTAGVLAVRRNAFVLAVLGLMGGFLTPYLLATREDHPVALFGYVLLLDLGVVAVARRRGWLPMRLLALAATALLFGGWACVHMDAVKTPGALVAAALLAALFGAFRPQPRGDAAGRDLGRAIPILSVGAPLLLAAVVCSTPSLDVAPAFLVAYLLVLAAGSWLVSRRADFSPLTPLAAGFSVLTLALRAGSDLFPARRTECLALFTILPAAYLTFWIVRRFSEDEPLLRTAAAIALAGAFPILLRVLFVEPSTEPIAPLWIYAFAHAMGFLVAAGLLRSGAWITASQGLLLLSLVALASRFDHSGLSDFLPLLAIPTVLYWLLPFLSDRFRRDRAAWLSSAAAPLLHYPILYLMAKKIWGVEILGAVAVAFGMAALAALRRAAALAPEPGEKRFRVALFGAVTLLFVTAAIPILLDKEWITVAWALEAAALAWLSRRLSQESLVKASAALAVAAFVRLVVNPELWGYHARSGTPIVNWYLYTFALPAAAFLFAARWSSGHDWARRVRMPEVLRAGAGVLLFVLLNVEIADFYSTGVSLTFRLSGGGLSEDMTYSLAWGVFAIALLFLGLARRSKPARAAALLVLLLTIAKVFLHDLWDLGALYRVGSIVGLAIALLAVSFLTQRFVLSREQP